MTNTAKTICKQITKITENLIRQSLAVSENYPSHNRIDRNKEEINIASSGSVSLNRSMPYEEKYKIFLENKFYNVKLIDGALLGMLYTFFRGNITKHMLFYFPAPHLEDFQNYPELYIEDDLYADILDKERILAPIRFDFDLNAAKPIEHPRAHLTLGQYKHCRIPVSAPLSPYQFVIFIIRNFYSSELFQCNLDVRDGKFGETLFEEEKSLTYLHVGY